MLAQRHSILIKEKAKKYGFQSCGISKAGFLEEEAPRLENWLNQNKHGEMGYMANHFDKRLDPTKLVEGAKSVISFSLNYYPEQELDLGYKISKYAYGKDYHKVIKKKLKHLLLELQEEIGDFYGRAFVDSAPVLDKAWAKKSGIGWVGKHSNLITKKEGSFFFLCEIITDLELEPDSPTSDHCGKCTRCIDACPTQAITEPYIVDGSKCISYLTIELKDAIPASFKNQLNDWAFGCDVCQDVCPWNRHSKPHSTPEFNTNETLASFNKKEWEEITEELFNTAFEGSAVKRTKLSGIQRNVQFLKGVS